MLPAVDRLMACFQHIAVKKISIALTVKPAMDYGPKGTGFDPRLDHKKALNIKS
jgi:hypothetical protein